MKRIKAACLLQTICFQSKDSYPSDFKLKKQNSQQPVGDYFD